MYKQRQNRRGATNYETQCSDPLLRDRNMSVFRLVKGEGLSQAIDWFESASSTTFSISRAEALQKPPALNQLEMREVRFHRHILGNVPVQDAIDAIYEGVPSVRRKLPVKIGEVAIFGTKDAVMRPVAVCFDPQSTAACQSERDEILETLESLAPGNNQEFDWLYVKTPHISVGTIHRDTPQPEIEKIKSAIQSALPENLILRGATLHNPQQF